MSGEKQAKQSTHINPHRRLLSFLSRQTTCKSTSPPTTRFKTYKEMSQMSRVQKRLMRDFREMVKLPLRSVSAAPLENNLFVWHANLMGVPGGPYEGAIFHVVIRFPKDYPNKAPSIRPLTRILHPNVFYDHICLNILESGHGQYHMNGEGWSSAYTVSTVLMQLQAFLLDHADVEAGFWGHFASDDALRRCISQSQEFCCGDCGHSYQLPYPPFKDEDSGDIDDDDEGDEVEGNPLLSKESAVVELEAEQHALKSKNEKEVYSAEIRMTKRNLLCYHSKFSYTDDILGIGVSVEVDTKARRISKLNSPIELLSRSAFYEDGIRIDAFKKTRFDYWIPMYINEAHFNRAFKHFDESVDAILSVSDDTQYRTSGHKAVNVICKLMNSMVLNMMNGTTHASFKALEGFCQLHRLLIEVNRRYPYVQKYVDTEIRNFINPHYRNKENVPVLGEWLNLLTVSSIGWNSVCQAYVEETLTRNVLWTFRNSPALENPKGMSPMERVSQTFESQKISMHLMCFHSVFLRFIGRPANLSLDRVKERYDTYMGFPSCALTNEFQSYCKRVQGINSFPGVYACLGMKTPTLEQFTSIIDSCIEASAKKGYHRPRAISTQGQVTERKRK